MLKKGDGVGKGLKNCLKLIMILSQVPEIMDGGTEVWMTGATAYSNLYKL